MHTKSYRMQLLGQEQIMILTFIQVIQNEIGRAKISLVHWVYSETR